MDKDYLKKNRLRQVSATFLGRTVSRVIDEDAQRLAYDRGHLDELNWSIKGGLSADLLTPTLKYLINNKLAVVIESGGMRDENLLETIFSKLRELKSEVLLSPIDETEVHFFLYAGDNAYRSIIESEYIFRVNAYDPRARKIFGIYYDHCQKVGADQFLLGAIPKTLIAEEKFIPHFVQEIIDNQ